MHRGFECWKNTQQDLSLNHPDIYTKAHLPLFLLAPSVCVGGMWLSPSPKHHALTTSGAGFFSSSSAKPLCSQHRFGSCHLIFCAFHPSDLLSANNFVLTICIHTCLSGPEVQAMIALWDKRCKIKSRILCIEEWINLCRRQFVFLFHMGKSRLSGLVFYYLKE